jgi:FHA domain
MIRLTVKQGSILQTLTVEGDKVFVGRLDSNSVKLDHPSVSPKHCLLRRTSDGDLELLDLNSKRGTTKNGTSVERAGLKRGDEIGVGEVRLTVEELSGEPHAVHTGYSLAPPEKSSGADEVRKKPRETPPARELKELVSEGHRTTFGEQIYSQFRRAPAWAFSIFFHVLLVYFFMMVPFLEAPPGSPFGSLNGDVSEDFSSLLKQDHSDPDQMLRDLARELDELPAPSVDEKDPELMDDPEALEDLPEFLPELGPTAASFSSRLTPSNLSTSIGVPDVEFGKDGATGANEKAVGLLRRSLSGRGASSMALLRELKAREVLVVKGQFDHVEVLLDMIDIKYDLVEVKRLERTSLAGRKVVFVNCTHLAPSLTAIRNLKEFVKAGGYLISSDWSIVNVIERAFPGYIAALVKPGNMKVLTPDEVIRISEVPGSGHHFLLNGTSIGRNRAKWWLEESSYPFSVLRPKDVDVLIDSDDLDRKYGVRPVAVTFRFGRGRVMHMLGHFFQQEGNLQGTFSAQRLIANFLIAAIKGR